MSVRKCQRWYLVKSFFLGVWGVLVHFSLSSLLDMFKHGRIDILILCILLLSLCLLPVLYKLNPFALDAFMHYCIDMLLPRGLLILGVSRELNLSLHIFNLIAVSRWTLTH
jgi:hypothetical protein